MSLVADYDSSSESECSDHETPVVGATPAPTTTHAVGGSTAAPASSKKVQFVVSQPKESWSEINTKEQKEKQALSTHKEKSGLTATLQARLPKPKVQSIYDLKRIEAEEWRQTRAKPGTNPPQPATLTSSLVPHSLRKKKGKEIGEEGVNTEPEPEPEPEPSHPSASKDDEEGKKGGDMGGCEVNTGRGEQHRDESLPPSLTATRTAAGTETETGDTLFFSLGEGTVEEAQEQESQKTQTESIQNAARGSSSDAAVLSLQYDHLSGYYYDTDSGYYYYYDYSTNQYHLLPDSKHQQISVTTETEGQATPADEAGDQIDNDA
ncbi:hypothetical protein EV182_001388, partial [Spiromyces aspiralis]